MIDREEYKARFSIPDASGVPALDMIRREAEIRKRAVTKKVISIICAAIAVLVLSNGVCYAATGETWVGKVWTTVLANGAKAELREDENGSYSRVESHWDDVGYTVYENGRTYFVFKDIKTDITDIVAGGKDYYKYEYTDEQNIRHIIFVGEMILDEVLVGGPKEYCSLWMEQIYYPNGQVQRVGVMPEPENWPEWAKKAAQDYPGKANPH